MQNQRRPSMNPMYGKHRSSRSRMRAQRRKRRNRLLALVGVILLIVIIMARCKGNKDTPANNETTQENKVVTQEPTAITQESTQEPVILLGDLVSVTETKMQDKNICVIKAKITPSYNNKATIKQNYINIEHLIQNMGYDQYDELQYWAVADMADGTESKVFSCTVNKSLISSIKAGVISVDGYEVMVDDLWILPSLLQ